MPVTDLTINIAILSGLIGGVTGVTAMFVSLREKVKDHEVRLQYHSQQIHELKEYESKSNTQFALILQRIDTIIDKLSEMKSCN
jgi:hypothetical protein